MSLIPFLSQIYQETVVRVAQKKLFLEMSRLEAIAKHREPKDFIGALAEAKKTKSPIISELKRRSPSQGDLFLGADAVGVASGYVDVGATCLSILTEPLHFGGELKDLMRIRSALPATPLLMKDFVIDAIQIAEGAAAGADAILLMVSLLNPSELKSLMAYARSLGLTAIVEVHDFSELEIALRVGADVIGVNNRDLRTLKVSLDVSRGLISLIPEGAFAICESGLSTSSEVTEMLGLGFDACLIGTSLMKNQNPSTALKDLLGIKK
ncbi:MAG: indole-3-glycerol phosphate synthase TrpC [Bdellovibrionales bacterium]|nr:indole-3-glycerol phosphate synthase TrpC [Bdellovibrionales bacterium]